MPFKNTGLVINAGPYSFLPKLAWAFVSIVNVENTIVNKSIEEIYVCFIANSKNFRKNTNFYNKKQLFIEKRKK